MSQLVCELIVTVDGFARGTRSPAYFGYFGPEFDAWIKRNTAVPHRTLIGRKTYEALAEIPEEGRDEGWRAMVSNPGWLFSRTVTETEWPGLEVVATDVVEFVGEVKQQEGSELRTLGSLSLVRQLLAGGLVDRIRLVVCPLIIPQSGIEPAFGGAIDQGFELVESKVLDGRVLLLDYRPTGAPPRSE